MRRLGLVLASVLFATAAFCDPQIPQISAGADAYRASIEAIRGDQTAAQLLTAIRRAETAKMKPELVRLYERFVALNSGNFRAWLQLGLAWRDAEPQADKGMSAAYLAYRTAKSPGDQLEAMLLMSSFLRTRLDRHRSDYEAAQRDLLKAQRYLAYLDDPDRKDEIVIDLDPKDPAGNRRRLLDTEAAARRLSEQALEQITQTVANLDEVYKDIATSVPRVGLDKMKEGDSRSAVFTLVLGPRPTYDKDTDPTADRMVPRVDFPIEGTKVNACVEFTQDLKTGDASYKRYVRIKKAEEDMSGFSVTAKARTLCISDLEAGSEYEITLLKDLPSKLDAKLTSEIVLQKVVLPNLPQQVAFLGRNFILPVSGPGEVPLYTTNVERFDLQLYRVTDRTLHRQIALNFVGEKLPFQEYADLRDHFAELMWSGTMQLQNPKQNTSTRVLLQVRSLLNARADWLRREVDKNIKDRTQMVSPPVPFPAVSTEPVGGAGQYFVGAPTFEKAALDVNTPSVYALVTRDLTEKAKPKRSDCEDDCSDYLVQWFVDTDIGLTFYEGDQDFTVVARSLRTGAAKAKARIELVTASNRILGSGETDANGVVVFPRSLTRGTQSNKLVAILAYHRAENARQDDFSFLAFGPERLDLSRLNVDGRPLIAGFNGFLTTDRGIYQPGETVRLLALIRDAQGVVPDDAPQATVRLDSRDRTLVQKKIKPQDWVLGGQLVPIEIPANMRAGTARITLSVGRGDETIVAERVIQIGPVRPDRARILDKKDWKVSKTAAGIAIEGNVSAQYLYASGEGQGAVRDVKAEIYVRLGAAESPAGSCYDKYQFGRYDENVPPVSVRHFVQFTDTQGNLELKLSGIEVPRGTRPVAATVEITLFDVSGPLASRSIAVSIPDDRGWVGVAKVPSVRSGERPGTFDVGVDLISITAENKAATERSLSFRLTREREYYVWVRRDDTWQHVKSVQPELVKELSIPTEGLRTPPAAGSNCVPPLHIQEIARGLEVGRYVLTVNDPQTGRESAVRFQTGVASTSPDQLEPNIFTLSAVKSSYAVGEAIELKADVPFDGELLVAFAEGDILQWASGQVRNGSGTVSLRAPREWQGKGIHALATVFRSGADGSVAAGPARAIGATQFEVKGDGTGFKVAIDTPTEAAPNGSLAFKACIADAAGVCIRNAPKDAYAAAFVVDEGLLSLTGHHDVLPDPESHFFGRKRLGIRVMDNYNRLLLKEGGDRPTRMALSNYTSPRIVSLAQGPVKLENGTAQFNIPNIDMQNGAVSVFVVVWTKDYAAAQERNVRVTGLVVADIDAPSFLYAGDRVILPLRLDASNSTHLDFNVKVSGAAPLGGVALFESGTPPQVRPNAEFRVTLPTTGPKTIYVAVEAPADARGKATLNLALEAVGLPRPMPGHQYSWPIELRTPALTSVDTVGFPLRQQSTNLSSLVQGLINEAYDAGNVTITARFSDSVQSLLTASTGATTQRTSVILEHLIWRGLFLLYASDAGTAERKQELGQILSEIQSLQMLDGSFQPYRTVGDLADTEFEAMKRVLPTVRVLDLMSLASAAGYDVPDQALKSSRQFVERSLKNGTGRRPGSRRSDDDKCSLEAAYGWLVLVRLAQVRPVAHEKISEFETCAFDRVSARAAAAAMAARYGLSDQARTILAEFPGASDPTPSGVEELKALSDVELAMTLSFLREAKAPAPLINVVFDTLFARDRPTLSKAALGWAVRAGADAGPVTGPRFGIADLRVEGAPANFLRVGPNGVIESAPFRFQRPGAPITVTLRRNVQARGFLTIEGPITKPSAIKRVPVGGLKRRFFRLDGTEINLAQEQLQIGERLFVVIEGNNAAVDAAFGTDLTPPPDPDNPTPKDTEEPSLVLLADLIPSAFQILSGNAFAQNDFKLQGALRDLKALGDLRSVETDPDRWVAVIVPDSVKASKQEAQPGQPPQMPAPGGIAFRQGYIVQLNMAGRFTLPALSIESTTPPARTLRAEQSAIEIKAFDVPRR